MAGGGGSGQDGNRAGGTPTSSASRSVAGLNHKQARFVAEYLKDSNATQAAIRAGYSKKTAGSQAHDLLKKPEISEAVRVGQQQRLDSAIATRVERQRFWTEVMQGSGDMRDRLKASELLGKSEADFTEKVEHSGKVAVTRIERVIVEPEPAR